MYGSKYQFILITGGPVLKHLGYVLFALSLCTEQASITALTVKLGSIHSASLVQHLVMIQPSSKLD